MIFRPVLLAILLLAPITGITQASCVEAIIGKPIIKAGTYRIAGYANFFGIRDVRGDIILPGAFAKSIDAIQSGEKRLKMWLNHDGQGEAGEWTFVKEDEHGIYVEGYIDTNLPKGKEAIRRWRNRPYQGLSIAGLPAVLDRNHERRLLNGFDLYEISITSEPAQAEAHFWFVDEPPTRSLRNRILHF